MKEFETLARNIGELESAIAVASFRAMMGEGEWCLPELSQTGEVCLAAEQIYHPMIEEPVKNSISVKDGVLLTGSNASGKSTFLKTLAINGILAQTIHTCLAKRYASSYYQIYTSMALRDVPAESGELLHRRDQVPKKDFGSCERFRSYDVFCRRSPSGNEYGRTDCRILSNLKKYGCPRRFMLCSHT